VIFADNDDAFRTAGSGASRRRGCGLIDAEERITARAKQLRRKRKPVISLARRSSVRVAYYLA
jgi:hypothetical protein